MDNIKVKIRTGELPEYDVVVCGGGFAGAAAAINSARNGAKTLLIENGGELGGDITKGLVIQLLDPSDKGGLVRDIYEWLNQGGHTSARYGERYDSHGKKLPGTVVDLEYTKYYLERKCRDAGVEILYHSLAADVIMNGSDIEYIVAATESGCFRVRAKCFIDATGNGVIAKLAGCRYECGHPETGQPQPAGSALFVTGMPEGTKESQNGRCKERLKEEMEAKGIKVSAEGIAVIQTAIDGVWMLAFNSQFNVMPDDPLSLSKAQADARLECLEVFDAIKKLKGYENLQLLQTSSHIGIREGRRIIGKYRLDFDDITTGKRFDDAICLTKFGIDVHRISPDDKFEHSQGKRVVPYNIPFRALIPEGCDNLLLAGRCISGDFYAHSSYRVIGNVVATGEAAGWAAAEVSKTGFKVADIDGTKVSKYMESIGYKLS